MNLTKTFLASLLVLVSVCSACEWDTTVRLKDSNPPQFRLSGSGKLAMLRMVGQQVRSTPPSDASVVWEIAPREGQFGGTGVGILGSITYGEIPPGYLQKYPEEGKPPPLVEGQLYAVRFETTGANGAHVYFIYRKGRLVETNFQGVAL
jgi:hypothetical protein